MLRWLERQPDRKGLAELVELTPEGARVRFDAVGVRELFDQAYAASSEERAYPRPLPNKEPLRTESRTTESGGRIATTQVYIYPAIVPAGAFLAELDPSPSGENPLWLKLWRDLLWTILRGVPKQRVPYEMRAAGKTASDAAEAWAAISGKSDASLDLASTYFLGAMAHTAESVPFRDRQRFQFLLHFWPFVAQIYVPSTVDRTGKRSDLGFVLAFPDVANLQVFCERFPAMMRQRDPIPGGFRPRGSRIDVAVEAGLEVLARLGERLAESEGGKATGDVVLGVDFFHADKPGKAVKIVGAGRVVPLAAMIDRYRLIRSTYWDHVFRRQRLLNLVDDRDWFHGFDRTVASIADEHFLRSHTFLHDVREAFRQEGNSMSQSSAHEPRPLEALVYQLVRSYVRGRLKSKHGLEWSEQMKGTPTESDFNENRGKLAREAFLAVRSRTGADFIEYFAATLCSTPQWLPEADFLELTRQLHEQTEKIRTLTLLALSAQGYTTRSEERNVDNG